MIEAFVKNGRLMALLIILIIVSGFAAVNVLPRSEDPHMVNRAASVITRLPGASAERVEALITEKIEQKLQKLAEIDYLASTSRPEISVIQVKLKGEVSDSEPVFSRIRDLLADVRPLLPADALEPMLIDERTYAFTQLVSLNWVADEPSDLLILGRYATELKSQLRLLANTDFVDIYGQNDEEILVQLDKNVAAMAGISLIQVSQAIANADVKVPAGKLINKHNQMQIELTGALDSIARIRNIPIISDSQSPLLVGDVATVKRQVKTPMSEYAIVNGKPALVVGTRMIHGNRIDKWSNSVSEKLNEFAQLLPGSIQLEVLFDQNTYTETRLTDLIGNIIIGFAIIALVLFISLGIRSAIIVVISLPLTVLFTLSVMNYYGLPIHQMSVTGLVVALGIMVDNAIVMTDTVQQKKQQGINGLQAVLESVRHLWLPLLGSTATTVLAFMPIVLMPGDAGEFVGGIALSVIFALIGSYLISHTIVAGLAGRFIKVNSQKTTWYHNGLSLPKAATWFQRTLDFTLKKPKTMMILVLILPILGFVMAKQLDEQFFPASDRDMFQIELYMPAQTSIKATKGITEQVSATLAQYAEIEKLRWFIGKSAPSFYYNMVSAKDGMQNYAQAMITAKDFSVANRLIPELQVALDKTFPQAQILVRKLEQGPPFNAPIEVRVFGPNLDTLQELGNDIRRVFSQTENIVHSRATLLPGTPKVWLQADEDTLNGLNLHLVDVAKQLESALEGAVQGSIIEATESINVRVKISDSEREDINALANFPIVNPHNGSYLPLSAISQVKVSPSRGAIPHRDGMRVNVIEGYIRSGVLPSTVLSDIQARLAEQHFVLPSGYSIDIGGESGARDRAVSKLMSSVGVILTILITVVVLSFNSFRISSIIFISAFMSIGLGLLSVYVFNHPFGFTVIIGLLGLMGLAINSAIVILAELKADPMAVIGDKSAIIHGVLSCTRHISSTTITTLGGFLPLILAGGGFWPPFAIAIAGGTVLTTLLSFYFVPAAFYLMSKKRNFEKTSVALS
ncbi:efflux RND transporter permease subunit [Thalassotalea sp. ND16A]|uniref:efflux RND transporter permease subunit n=1 Tax=Thalassotalea sp. ND16A TaxID=1535422 RepID=UPI00051A2C80|nr:efflux RND transporter permease subunit [Thalassotalea sp. ND16A]KGK01009.1 hypothetical protein ND16A_3211 [Thalassotalea sp. ND16A]